MRRALKKEAVVTAAAIDYRRPAELRALLTVALKHDAETFDETREEHRGQRARGTTPRHKPIAPFVVGALLIGARASELLALDWQDVDLDTGEIRIHRTASITKRARVVDLSVSPALIELLTAMRPDPAHGLVFGLDRWDWIAAERRLAADAPNCNLQALRRTCGTYLTNAPGIFGAASAYRSAKQLGHSVQVAEKHYVGVVRGIPREARTLEAAMQIEAELQRVIAAARARAGSSRVD